MMAADRHQMRQKHAAGRDRLEAAGTPAAAHVEPGHRRRADDRRGIRHDIDIAGPLPHQLQLAEGGEHLQEAGQHGPLHRRVAALGVGGHAIEAAADHDLALVGLEQIGAGAEIEHHRVEAGLDRFRDHRLQRVGLDRQVEARESGEHARISGDGHACHSGADRAAACFDAGAAPVLDQKAGDLAVLDDVDARPVGGTRIAPGDRVVAGDAGAALPHPAEDRVARVVAAIEQRCLVEDLVGAEQFGVGTVDLHRVDDARGDLHLALGMGDGDHATLREHDVVVDLARQPLVEFQGIVVERDALGVEIIGPDRAGVAAGIAAAEPALLDHSDIGDAVVLCQIVGRGEAVSAAADHHRVISRFRFRAAPCRLPAFLAGEALLEERKGGIALRHFS